MLPRLYNKKVKNGIPIVLFLFVILYTIKEYFTGEISQVRLETEGMVMNKQSSYDPRPVHHEVYSFIGSFLDKDFRTKSEIGTDEGIYFHWDDWTDLHAGKKILDGSRKDFPDGRCDEVLHNFASVSGYYMETYDRKVYRGMANLYCLKDIPKKIIVPTDSDMIEVPVIEKKRLGSSGFPVGVTKNSLVDQMTTIQNLEENEKFKSKKIKKLKNKVAINTEDFLFSPDLELFKLRDKKRNGNLDDQELEYMEFLEYSTDLVSTADRYFKYPWIISDVWNGRSHHIAYPFFRRFIGNRERQSVIQHMIRAWFQFAEANDFISWINYGSLLGWAFNGVNMPWDTDVDIQMPIIHLNRLGREFNRSLILENPRYGNSRYFLEVAPTYIKQGNGKNFIDARFIDINSGLYIDISALSHTEYKAPDSLFEGLSKEEASTSMAVNCKNWNWHTLEELFPLKHTFFEGGSAYIPHNISRLLGRKYGESSYTTDINYKGYNYQDDIHLWVEDEICSSSPPGQRFADTNKSTLTFSGACNNEYLQDEYQINYEMIKRHLELHSDIDSINLQSNEMKDLPFSRKDVWDYYSDLNKNFVKDDRWYIKEEVVEE